MLHLYTKGGGEPETKIILPRNKVLLHATRCGMRSGCRPPKQLELPPGSSQAGGRGWGGGGGGRGNAKISVFQMNGMDIKRQCGVSFELK